MPRGGRTQPYVSRKRPMKTLGKNQRKEVTQVVKRQQNRNADKKVLAISLYDSSLVSSVSNLSVITLTAGNINQGVQDAERVGRKLQPVEVNFTYRFGADQDAAAPTYETVRVILFQFQDDVTINPPAMLDILESFNLPNFGVDGIISAYQHPKLRPFNILLDKRHVINRSANCGVIKHKKFTGKSLRPIYFNAPAGTLGKGHFYLIALTDDNNVAALGGTRFGYNFTIRYTDM